MVAGGIIRCIIKGIVGQRSLHIARQEMPEEQEELAQTKVMIDRRNQIAGLVID